MSIAFRYNFSNHFQNRGQTIYSEVTYYISVQLLPDSCSCITKSCDCNRDVFVSVLLPSLTSTLHSLATPTSHTPTCLGRIHHSSVYDPHSDSIFLFGGLDLGGNICDGDVVRVDLGPSRSGVEVGIGSGWVGSGESGDSLVRIVGGNGFGPPGHYLHTANMIQVSRRKRGRRGKEGAHSEVN